MSGNGADPSTSASAVSLGKRPRSVSPSEGGSGSSSSKKNGHAQAPAAAADNNEAAASQSDSDDDGDVGPMPMPEGGDDSDNEAGPMPAGGKTTSKALAKRRKVLKYEKVYLDNLPSADRYYSKSFGYAFPRISIRCINFLTPFCGYTESFMHRDIVSWVSVTRYARLPPLLSIQVL